MNKSSLLIAAASAVCIAAPASAATDIIFKGTVKSSFDQLGIFDAEVIGEEFSLTYTAEFGLPTFVEYVWPIYYVDICGPGCTEFGGYGFSYLENPGSDWDNLGQGWVVGAEWRPQDITTTLKLGGRSFVFKGKTDSRFYIMNDYGVRNLTTATLMDGLQIQTMGQGFETFFDTVGNEDLFTTVNLNSTRHYDLNFGNNAFLVEWNFYDGAEWRQTMLGITPLTMTTRPSGAPQAVPEPATWLMMLVGFGGIGTMARRSRKANVSVIYA